MMKFILCAFLSLTQLIWSSTKSPPISSSPMINQTWSPPPLGWVKFNFAASQSSSTAGCVARSSEGVFLGGWAAHCGYSSASGEVGEACAAQLACTAALAYGYSRVILEGDGESVVNAINGGSGFSWEAHVYVHDCMQILGQLESFLVGSVDRSANGDAHKWANWAHSNDFQGFLVGDDLSLLVAGLDHQ